MILKIMETAKCHLLSKTTMKMRNPHAFRCLHCVYAGIGIAIIRHGWRRNSAGQQTWLLNYSLLIDVGSNWIHFWTHSWPHQALIDFSNSMITNQNKSYGSWKGIVLGQVTLTVVGGRWEKVGKEELLHRIIYMYEIVTAQLNKNEL